MDKIIGQAGLFSLVGQEKEFPEFKPAVLRLKIDPVSHPARDRRLVTCKNVFQSLTKFLALHFTLMLRGKSMDPSRLLTTMGEYRVER